MLRRAAVSIRQSALTGLLREECTSCPVADGPAAEAAFLSRGLSSSATGQDPKGAAFVFDIDGVLIRGGTVLPAARRALAKLYTPGGERPKVPVCFLTNGGGVTEATKAAELSAWLDVDVHENQVVLAHTPFRRLHHLKDKPVLVAGVGSPAEVAHHYGFCQPLQVLTLPQLHAAQPHAAPFAVSPPDDEPLAGDIGSEGNPIAAVLVMKDPADWYRDTQLVLDVLTSGGVPGRDAPPPGSKPVELYISNPDMLWANEHPVPRLGQGAFAAILKALHIEVTGAQLLHLKYYGKPNPAPYRLIEAMLTRQAAALGLTNSLPTELDAGSNAEAGSSGSSAAALDSEWPTHPLPFSMIFGIGDNPASDIRGANRAGRPWVSTLVRTGVFRGGANSESDPADIVVEDVEAAVAAGLHRARSEKWHSMR